MAAEHRKPPGGKNDPARIASYPAPVNTPYPQAFEYWTRITPYRPRYVALCNFDEFWIYDFDQQLDEPMDIVPVVQMTERASAFGFMLPVEREPLFENNRVDVTREAADKVAAVFNMMVRRGEERGRAQRFILQCVVAMFSEDAALLKPKDLFLSLLDECSRGGSTYDLIGGLFRQMNDPNPARAGRYREVEYFNGGIFASVDPVELTREEVASLMAAAKENWSKIQPVIFGTLFQGSLLQKDRHALGAHFTSEADIQSVVLPTIVRPWRQRIEVAKTLRDLTALRQELLGFRVLDPACDSGNFLYVAYRELRRIELSILTKIHEQFGPKAREQAGSKPQVSLKQFFGIEKSPFGADYCVYWFRKAHDHLARGGRAGLVGTNTVRQNYSREGGLDYIVGHGGTITEAISTQVWDGDAVVHVSVVNWVKGEQGGKKRLSWQVGDDTDSPWEFVEVEEINSALSPKADVSDAVRLRANMGSQACYQGQTPGNDGFVVDPAEAERMRQKNPENARVLLPYLIGDDILGSNPPAPQRFVIDFQPRDVVAASSFKEPFDRVKMLVLPARQGELKEEEKRNKGVLDATPGAKVNRHHANFLKRWWLMSYSRKELVGRIAGMDRYIACSRVTKRPVFVFASSLIRPGDSLQVFPLDDDYSFGVLQSDVHWEWFTLRCSTMKAEPRYTSNTVFDTFPWPQGPKAKAVEAVARAAVALRAARAKLMDDNGRTLRELYRLLEMPGANPLRDAQSRLDAAVRDAYGIKPKDRIAPFLLALNRDLAQKESAGEAITRPGLPADIGERSRFVTKDCIVP